MKHNFYYLPPNWDNSQTPVRPIPRQSADPGRFGAPASPTPVPIDGPIREQAEEFKRLRAIAGVARRQPRRAITALYLLVLSRHPTVAEIGAIERHRRSTRIPPRQLVEDLVWALINSKEFLHAH